MFIWDLTDILMFNYKYVKGLSENVITNEIASSILIHFIDN